MIDKRAQILLKPWWNGISAKASHRSRICRVFRPGPQPAPSGTSSALTWKKWATSSPAHQRWSHPDSARLPFFVDSLLTVQPLERHRSGTSWKTSSIQRPAEADRCRFATAFRPDPVRRHRDGAEAPQHRLPPYRIRNLSEKRILLILVTTTKMCRIASSLARNPILLGADPGGHFINQHYSAAPWKRCAAKCRSN